MTANAFDMVRKIRHLPGIQVTATVDPKQISKRVKNAAQKMVRTGVLENGYSSRSRLLAEQLHDTFRQPAVGSAAKWGAFISDTTILNKDGREQIVELLNASRVIEHANTRGSNDRYINERYDNMIKEVKAHRFGRLSFRAWDTNIHQQILSVVSACRTPEQVAAHEALAAKLDSTEPIIINIYE